MSEGLNISNLSYKELQALALRYRVPGNIKKQLLIEVLQAARCGNEQEVDKLLADLRQNRKKRIRKGKPTKLTISLASTPIHSPNYDMADDYYAAQHRLPYQWVGAEEEIPNRQLDEGNRVPQYEEFRQFLLRRIQRDYQTYNTSHNEKAEPADPGGIMDLRNDQGESIRFETDTAVGMRSNNMVPVTGLGTVQSYSEQMAAHNPAATAFDYQILEDPNGNGSASILLRRMLQAPVGADLGEIASPELGPNCKIWGNDQYQSQNNLLDNSDTLSANSDVNGNDDDNWPIATEYYRFVNNVRDQLILNTGNIPGGRPNFDQLPTAGQFCSVLTDNNPVQYQLLYTNQMPDLQQQHQQQQQQGQQGWETAAGPFDGDVLNYQKPKNQESKMFPAGTSAYYDCIAPGNYAATRLVETDPLQQQYVAEDGSTAGFSGNRTGFESNNDSTSAPSRSEVKFYHNLNDNTEREGQTAEGYSSMQNSAGRINDANNYALVRPPIHSNNFYASGEALQQTHGFIPPMPHLSFSDSHQQQPPPAHNGYVENLGCTSSSFQTPQPPQSVDEFNRSSIFGQYHMMHKIDPLKDESQQLCHDTVDRDGIRKSEEADGETERTNLGSTSTTQSDSTTSLEPFWPQRSGVKNTTDSCLENILNLNTYGYVDYSKIDQTSCIYCYSAPIVTQRLFTAGSSSCSQKKRFVAEFRQHTFSPYWLLYNDTDTGMQMWRHANAADHRGKESAADNRNSAIIETDVRGINQVAIDLENPENDRLEDVNDSEFPLEEEHLDTEVAENITDNWNQSHGKRMPYFDSKVQVQRGEFGPLSCPNNNNQDKTPPPVDLNMENSASC